MNSKKLCCICVLFSLLAGCASESSIDEKKKKAQVTQSNINKNTPQQLTDKDLFGNETTLAVSEEDIQAALDGDEFRVPLNSPVILVQSGNRAPETIMQEEMRKYYTVATFSGIPDNNAQYTLQRGEFEFRVASGDLEYIPALEMTIITSYPEVEFIYTGTPNYVPPKKEPDSPALNITI